MTPAIETVRLTKRYGKLNAVNDLTLSIPRGALYGFIGPNGAGKTTTLRMLAGLTPPSWGEIRVFGDPINSAGGADRRIGYMPDFFGVYEDMRVWEYLDFFGRCYKLPAARREQMVDELLELVDLAEKKDDDVEALSRGMQQRLCLAHALVHDPDILLLDEPASGLDPRARIEMRELLRELQRMGKTVLVSSHILAELAEMCDSVAIIERGKLLASGPVAAIERQLRPRQLVRVRVLSSLADALEVMRRIPSISVPEMGVPEMGVPETSAGEPRAHANGYSPDAEEPDQVGGWVEVEVDGDESNRAEALAALVSSGVKVASWTPVEGDLEALFMTVTKGEVA